MFQAIVSVKNVHFICLRVTPPSLSNINTFRRWSMCSTGNVVKMTMFSSYMKAMSHFPVACMTSMVRWKVLGAFFNPNGVRMNRIGPWCYVKGVLLHYNLSCQFPFASIHCSQLTWRILQLLLENRRIRPYAICGTYLVVSKLGFCCQQRIVTFRLSTVQRPCMWAAYWDCAGSMAFCLRILLI